MCLGLPRSSNTEMTGDPPGPFKLVFFGFALVVVMGFMALVGRLRRSAPS